MDVRFSIITVCYNSENTIERTIQSVLNQTYQNFEYIIIDGASTDATLDIVRKYEQNFNGRLRYISEPDQGIYDAMNKGIAMASGTLIGIVNSDDYYENDALEKVNESYMPEEKECIYYGFQRCVENEKEVRVVLYNHEYLDRQMITHPTCFVTKAVYDNYGGFDLNFKSSSDYEFMLKIFHETNVKFKPIYEVISNFQLGGMSSSELCVRETAQLHKKYGVISKGKYLEIMIRSYIHTLVRKK